METEVKLGFKDKESLYKVALSENFRKLCPDNSGFREPVLLEVKAGEKVELFIFNNDGKITVFGYKNIDTKVFAVEFALKQA